MQDILQKWEKKELTVEETVSALSTQLSSKNLLEFIKYHSTLTSQDPYKRLDALELLNLVLKNTSITLQQSGHLLEFYVSRLDDQLSVDQVLKGIYILLQSGTISKTDQLKIPKAIFTELDIQSFPQNTRYTCFQIFEYLLLNNTAGLEKISKDFISGFVTLMDGEKDPRNLLLLFKIVKLITLDLDISNNVTDLFEVVFCYFPITFRPPPDDVYMITSDDLKIALREAITSSPLYAIQAIPVLLEKLASSSNSAKRDAMDTISASLPVYTANPYLPHLNELWKGAKNEIAQALDEANELSALKLIREVCKHLPTAISISGESLTALERWMELVIPECLENLKHPEQKYAKACGKILMSASSAGKPAASLVITKTLPVLLKQLREENVPSKKQVLLQVVNDLVMACRLVYGTRVQTDTDEEMATSPLADYASDLIEIYVLIVAMDVGALKVTAIQGIYELVASQGLFTEDDRKILLSHLNSLVTSDDKDAVKESAVQLEKLAKEQPILIKDTSLRLFFEAGITEPSLKAISTICVEESVFEEASSRFFGMLATESDSSKLKPIVRTLLECIRRQESKQPVLAKQISHISTLVSNVKAYEMVVNTCHLDLVKILNLIIQSLSVDQQSEFFKSALHLDYFKNTESFPQLVFIQACICNARPKANLYIDKIGDFIQSLLVIGFHTENDNVAGIVPTIVGSLVNKLPEAEVGLDVIKMKCNSMIESTQPLIVRLRAVIIYSWVAKALVTKGDSSGHGLVAYLLKNLEQAELASTVCEGVEIIIKDHEMGYLTKQCFALQKILFKQKLYNFSAKLLLEGFEKSSEELKQYHLLALSHLLRNVPKSVLVNELPKLFPMLLKSLESKDSQLKQSTLDSFSIMVAEIPEIIINHIDVIINNLISLFIDKDPALGNNPYVRVKAINLLGQFPGKIEYSYLFPLKKLVIKKLGLALDDHKLVVRREAANSRGKWYMLVGQKEA